MNVPYTETLPRQGCLQTISKGRDVNEFRFDSLSFGVEDCACREGSEVERVVASAFGMLNVLVLSSRFDTLSMTDRPAVN